MLNMVKMNFNDLNDELSVEFENFGNESLDIDIYDLKYCNESCMYYDVENDLDRIKAKVLIIACKQDPHFPPELDAIPMSKMINDSELIVMDSDLGHLCFNELETISDELARFMSNFGDQMIVKIVDYDDEKCRVTYEVSDLPTMHLDYLHDNLLEENYIENGSLRIVMYFTSELYPFQSDMAKLRLDDFIAREEIEMWAFLTEFIQEE